ncbi:dihydrofolate reductase family protein [Candidatus Phytoplasma oryzae]|uniref:dihydrofolate reductase n=1 Tax=Candidatus Phytoplasma oryzae TaxID=203274 RepID=A0A139JQ99_9MOLU|nr:dihydrofolate reductase [Candidatus Phytoplasma oryzae]KXT29093.1 dihydrofolate reductase family protein [Candidatus Phytoplasma oryzae]KXT29147.1 dihydrofolate reductase family protein [Candidatus Phytoplasma oryzae]
MISLIVAFDSNSLIGHENILPWHYPEDILFFKKKTFNKDVLMGSKTYFSLKKYYKNKKLPFRKIYVASFKTNIDFLHNKDEEIFLIKNLNFFLKKIFKNQKDIIIIGGSQIYEQSLSFVGIMFITHILRRYKGNKFFPIVNYNDFIIIKKKISNELIFVTYKRK